MEKTRKIIMTSEIEVDVLEYPKDKDSIGKVHHKLIERCFGEFRNAFNNGLKYIYHDDAREVFLHDNKGELLVILKEGN